MNYYREGSIGIPYPDTYYKIVKPNTEEEMPYGEEGEILISGPSVMKGYLDNEEETKLTLRKHKDGLTWMYTGDLGYMDKDGFIYFKQRIKRMIISSGYSISPQYIENIIDSNPKVLMSCVIGIDHPYKIQVAKAFIVLRNEYMPNEEILKEIKEYCEKNLARYSWPYEYEFRTELPKTLVGKVAYSKLEEEERRKNEEK
jgi:long-chain acyl-CoA synthetase